MNNNQPIQIPDTAKENHKPWWPVSPENK